MPTSAERAYTFIKDGILSGHYLGGARLIEDTIATELSISRTPVRDAIRRLQSEGLIEFTPNSGARVTSWSETELGEVTQMRALLESFAAELAARKITPEQLDELNRLAADMERAVARAKGPDLDRMSADNLAFHRAIVHAADNGRLAATLEQLWAMPIVIRKYALFDRQQLERSLGHHREILAALRARDPQWAASIMRTHILAAASFDALLSPG